MKIPFLINTTHSIPYPADSHIKEESPKQSPHYHHPQLWSVDFLHENHLEGFLVRQICPSLYTPFGFGKLALSSGDLHAA
jgi:hypothetical protein